jgi:hypothetical protein
MAGETVTFVACPNCGQRVDAPTRAMHRGRLPSRIVDVLDNDGPLTAEGLGVRLDAPATSIYKALWRLHNRGMVVPSAFAGDRAEPFCTWRTV